MIRFVGKKNVSIKKIEEILQVSEKMNHYTNNGPVKCQLEKKLQNILNIRNKKVVCFNNGTSALHSLMFLCQKKHNIKKWAAPAFTFPSPVVSQIFDVDVLDIDNKSHTLKRDINLLKDCGGVIITNLFGSYVDLIGWEKFCKKNNKILIFDNASSPLSNLEGKNICNFGDYAFGSLHHTKILGFGEGGFAVVHPEEYEELNSINNFGFLGNRNYSLLSSNFKLSDVSAAFILSHLQNFSLDRHIMVQNKLMQGLKGLDVGLLNYKPGTVYGNLPVIFKRGLDVCAFKDCEIEVKKYYKPLLNLENSLDLYSKIINFPLYSSMKDGMIDKIVNCIDMAARQ